MAATVVSLSVQTGSGGFAVARRAAERLGLRYYDWEITSEAASRAGVSPDEVIAAERVPGFLERMMARLGAVSATGIENPGFGEPSPAAMSSAIRSLTSDDYRNFIERVVSELGQMGDALIVGHMSQWVLRDHPGALRVLVLGSPARRAQRLAEEQSIDLTRAQGMIKQADADRHDLLRRVYHFDWLDARMYDLSINTDHIPLDTAVDSIVEAAQKLT